MSKRSTTVHDLITDRFIRTVCERLTDNKRVRRNLPVWGRVHIDRQLPFLCLYRRPTSGMDPGTERLATSEASYLIASGDRKIQIGLTELVHAVARTMVDQFGAFLILEVWSGAAGDDLEPTPPSGLKPRFRIVVPKDANLGEFVDKFDEALSGIKVAKQLAQVEVTQAARCCPKPFAPILSASAANGLRCNVLGLEVRPIYRDPNTGEQYPLVLRDLRRGLTRALRRTFYEFACTRATHRPLNYHMLGRRAMVRAVWEVDRRLAEVAGSFDLLLQVTPVNGEGAWREFRKTHFEHAPVFHYRPLPADPIILKRKLYATPIERVEDPVLAQMFREKQDELDRQITLLLDINTNRFVHDSVLLFGKIDDALLRLAKQILKGLPPRSRDDSKGHYLIATAFAARAQREIDYYRRLWPEIDASVQLREDIASGLMVSHGSLLIGKYTRIPASRVDALLQHEIGTHVLTYYNGRAQPFRQLYAGFAGYEALQEGLAVLAEYLVGGLSRPRLRLLAARVVAACNMIDGASFVDTFRELNRTYGFERRTAFTVALRIYRGGGLTKDALYLLGLCQVLHYLGQAGQLEPLFIGKIATEHIPMIHELQWRGVLREPPLVPRYISRPDAVRRLERLRNRVSVLDLIERRHR